MSSATSSTTGPDLIGQKALALVVANAAAWPKRSDFQFLKLPVIATPPASAMFDQVAGLQKSITSLYATLREQRLALAEGPISSLSMPGLDVAGWSRRIADALAPFGQLIADGRCAGRVADAGWAPHRLIPRAELAPEGAAAGDIQAAIDDYVKSSSARLAEELACSIDGYTAVPRAAALQRQAILALQAGAPLLVPPAVFPEIERCARVILGDPSLGSTKAIKLLLQALGEMPISKLRGVGGGALVDTLQTRVYRNFDFGDDPAPVAGFINRHGSVHGTVEYNDERDAWNAVFLLDFVLEATVELLTLTRAA